MTAKTLSIIALVVSLINALTALVNFVLSRFRLISVRDIRSYAKGDDRYLSVDIVSHGSVIWDMEAVIEIYLPPTAQGVLTGAFGTVSICLEVLGQYLNPLNPGQGMRFEARLSEATAPDGHIIHKGVDEMIPNLARRNLALCVYCSGKRKRLRRIRSRRFHRQLDFFLNGKLNVKWSLYERVRAWWERRRVTRTHDKIQAEITALQARAAENAQNSGE